MRELEERLALVRIARMGEVRRARAEVPDRRRQARVVGQADEARVLHLEDELHPRQRDADAGAELAREEAVALRAGRRGSRRRAEPVGELAAEPLAERRRDVLG